MARHGDVLAERPVAGRTPPDLGQDQGSLLAAACRDSIGESLKAARMGKAVSVVVGGKSTRSKRVKSVGKSHAEHRVVRLVRCPFNTAYTRLRREVKRLPAEKSAPRRACRAKSKRRMAIGLEKYFFASIARAPAEVHPRAASRRFVGDCPLGKSLASVTPRRIARVE
jgi:hypothetical protein